MDIWSGSGVPDKISSPGVGPTDEERETMSRVYFIGDLHFGHTNVHKFRPLLERFGVPIQSEQEHREEIIYRWNRVVGKRDKVYVMGDAAFTKEGLLSIEDLTGSKVLVRGNHDLLNASEYLQYFDDVVGLHRYKKFWLSHCPIHPTELRGRRNIHGHCHNGGPDGADYFNTCLEHIGYEPIEYHEMLNQWESRDNEAT